MVPLIEEGHHLMADRDLFLEVHNMDLVSITQGLGMKDSRLEEENPWHNVIDHEPNQQT